MTEIRVPVRYVPTTLSRKDRVRQGKMLRKSRKLYKQRVFYTRKRVSSYNNKTSQHITNAKRIYNIDNVIPNRELATATGCSISALKKIVKKGEGAYYSSGSRPNQTAHSWGYARLASSITSGKSASVDYKILEDGCDHNKMAFKLASKSRDRYGYGNGKTRKTRI